MNRIEEEVVKKIDIDIFEARLVMLVVYLVALIGVIVVIIIGYKLIWNCLLQCCSWLHYV